VSLALPIGLLRPDYAEEARASHAEIQRCHAAAIAAQDQAAAILREALEDSEGRSRGRGRLRRALRRGVGLDRE